MNKKQVMTWTFIPLFNGAHFLKKPQKPVLIYTAVVFTENDIIATPNVFIIVYEI